MKNLFTVYLLCTTSWLFAQTPVKSVEIPLSSKETVIASAVTADNHYYVLTGAKSETTINGRPVKGKSTLLHFDADMKLVLKKPFKAPKYGKGTFEVLSLFVIGNQVVLIGKSEDYAKEKCKVGYTTIDQTTLVVAPKVKDIVEHAYANWSFDGNTQYEFRQHAPGTSVAMMIAYQTRIDLGEGKSIRKVGAHYLMLDQTMQVHSCLNFSNVEDEIVQRNGGFFISSAGDLYIAVFETDYVELKDEWWEDNKERAKLAAREHHTRIYKYTTSTKSRTKGELLITNETLGPGVMLMFESEGDVYIGGLLDDSQFRFKKSLLYDTVGMPENEVHYFFAQKISTGTEFVVGSGNATKITQEFYDEYFVNENIAQEDREMGAYEGISLNAAIKTADGKFIFAGGTYTDWHWPPYEEIKDDKNYSIEKDDKGHITRMSGPGLNPIRKYFRVFTVTFTPGEKNLSGKSAAVSIEKPMSSSRGSDHDVIPVFQCSFTGEQPAFYFDEVKKKKNGNDIFTWDGKGSPEKITFQHSGSVQLKSEASNSSRYVIVSGEDGCYLVRLE